MYNMRVVIWGKTKTERKLGLNKKAKWFIEHTQSL